MRKARSDEHNLKIGISNASRARGTSPNKKCPACKEVLPRTSFGLRNEKNSMGINFSNSYCRSCEGTANSEKARRSYRKHPELKEKRAAANRIFKLKKNYGITVEEYERLLASQNGVCAICEGTSIQKNRKFLYVDHCHTTGNVRGILCYSCNLGIGNFQDDTRKMEKAIYYLTHAYSRKLQSK